MRKSLFLAVCVLCILAFACQQTETTTTSLGKTTKKTVPADARNVRIDTVIQPAPIFADRVLLGSAVGADGNVTAEAVTFAPKEKVYLTMFLHDSPVGLKTRAVWTDGSKKEIHREDREMKGAKVVTFALDTKKLKTGHYHVDGYWGGNLATEKDFEIKGKK